MTGPWITEDGNKEKKMPATWFSLAKVKGKIKGRYCPCERNIKLMANTVSFSRGVNEKRREFVRLRERKTEMRFTYFHSPPLHGRRYI